MSLRRSRHRGARRRTSWAACLVVVSAVWLGTPSRISADPITGSVAIVNTIGPLGLDTQFSVFGSSGWPIFGLHPYGQMLGGPQFTLTKPSVLTSVGAFVENCETIMAGVPDCRFDLPLALQIRPALENNPAFGPDPSRLIATYTLSNDEDPFTISFESASFRLALQPGTYFALFAPESGEGGFILASAQDPFPFRAGSTVFGAIDPGTGFSFASVESGAVLVTASPVPEPSTIGLVLAGAAAAAGRRLRRRPRRS